MGTCKQINSPVKGSKDLVIYEYSTVGTWNYKKILT